MPETDEIDERERIEDDAHAATDAAARAAARHVAGTDAGFLLPDNIRGAAERGRDVRPVLEQWIMARLVALIVTVDGAHPLPFTADTGEDKPRRNDPTPRALDVEAAIRHLTAPGQVEPDRWRELLPGLDLEIGPLARHTIRVRGGLETRTGVRVTVRHPWLPREGAVSIVALAEDP